MSVIWDAESGEIHTYGQIRITERWMKWQLVLSGLPIAGDSFPNNL